MFGIFSAFTSLAVVYLGVRIATGNAGSMARIIPLGIRIGFILILLMGSIKYAGKMMDVFDQLVAFGGGGFSPWQKIDEFLADLLGFTKNVGDGSLKDGIIGLLNGSIFAKGFGFLMSMVGIFTVGSLIVFTVSALYVYLASFIAFCFLLIILPILLPFFLFTYTEGYFIKWFNLLLSTIITPTLLFGFLSVFLIDGNPIPVSTAAKPTVNKACEAGKPQSQCNPNFNNQPIAGNKAVFPSILADIKAKLGPDYMQRRIFSGQSLSPSLIMTTDKNERNYLACIGGDPSIDCKLPKFGSSPTATSSNPYFLSSIDYSPFKKTVIDFGVDRDEINKFLLQKFFELLIFTLILNSVVTFIPSLSASIAGGVSTGVANMSSPLTRALQSLNK
jgi:hypothetical protein